MAMGLENLPSDVEELKRIIAEQSQQFDSQLNVIRSENRVLREQVRDLKSRLFGKKSEKLTPFEIEQARLFNELEFIQAEPPELPFDAPKTQVASHERSPRRKSIPDHLPREDRVIDVPESEKVCSCGVVKARIGEETSEKLEYIPAKAFVIRTVRPKYACRACKGADDEGQPVVIAPAPVSIMGRSMMAEGFFAHVLVSKFDDGLPFYRQEKIFRRADIEISRRTMAETAIRVYENLKPLQELLYREILSAYLLGIDETTTKVLKEPGRRAEAKSYMWHIQASMRAGPIPIYIYRETRSAEFLDDFLKGYSGPIISDGYRSYNRWNDSETIVHAGCHAHARRKFVEAEKVSPGNTDTRQVIDIYRKLYEVEASWKKEKGTLERLAELRNLRSRPLIHRLEEMLRYLSTTVNSQSKLGTAISYTLGEWPKLLRFLDNPEIPIDNNAVENGIRPFVIGRKNWLFNDSVGGAHASAFFYTLIEGAKAAGLNPYLYMTHLLQSAASAQTEEEWRALLPLCLKDNDLLKQN